MPLVTGELRDVQVAVLPGFARCMPQPFTNLSWLLYLQLGHASLVQHRSHHSCVPEGTPTIQETD